MMHDDHSARMGPSLLPFTPHQATMQRASSNIAFD
jgi:hypothetical protein